MNAPVWLTGAFVAMMLGVAGFCLGRLVVARRTRRPAEIDSDIVHVLMGVAMAGMLVARLRFGSSALWAVVFAGGVAWFGWETVRRRSGRGSARAGAGPGADPDAGAGAGPGAGPGAGVADVWRCAQPVPHLLECGAMVYMVLALPRPGRAMGMSGSGLSFIALLFAAFMVGYVMWLGDRFPVVSSSPGAVAGGACARVLAPRCGMVCKMAMGVTMAYLLVLML